MPALGATTLRGACVPKNGASLRQPDGRRTHKVLGGQKQEERRVAPALGGMKVAGYAMLYTHSPSSRLADSTVSPIFLPNAANKPAHAVRLPAGRLHDLGERRTSLPLE